MFGRIQRLFQRTRNTELEALAHTIDGLNARTHGGAPVVVDRRLGELPLRSGAIIIADPQYVPGLEVANIAASRVAFSAMLRRYPNGTETVVSLTLQFGDEAELFAGERRQIGEIAIDSAKVVIADKQDFEESWTEVGPDRIGVISTARDDTVLRLLTKRFKLKTVRRNRVRTEIVGPVSPELESEITTFLEADPKYGRWPFVYFNVQTNNSFERADFCTAAYQLLPIGRHASPLMFVCDTGRGDGSYDVEGVFDGPILRSIFIRFIEDDDV